MDSIGEIVALRGAATAQGQDGVRELAVGSPVFSGDVLSTGQDSNLEVRFVDDTVLAQGPGASLTVDNYVFDPQEPSASAMLMNLSKGTFRLVTGSIAKDNPEGIALSSPLATIGIRGTGADLDIGADGVERYGIFQYDGLDLVITTARGTVFLTNQGLVVDVNPDGSLGAPRPYTPDELQMFQTLAPLSVILGLGQDDGQGGDEDGDGGQDGDGDQQDGEGPGDGADDQGQDDSFDPDADDPFDTEQPQGQDTLPGAAIAFTPPRAPSQPSRPAGGDDDTDNNDGQAGNQGGTPGGPDDDHYHEHLIYGTEGPDLLNYAGASNSLTIYGLGGNDTIYGGSGDDYIDGGAGDDSILAGQGDDHIVSGEGNNYIDGGMGQDTVSYEDSGTSVSGYLSGTMSGIGTDTLSGIGTDTLVNIEHLIGSAFGDSLHGDSYDNIIWGKAGDDILHGKAGNDTIYGDEGNDLIFGDDGDDYIDGGEGDDTIDGGAGNDTISYEGSDAGVLVVLQDPSYPGTPSGGHADGDTITNVENVVGSDHNDAITGNSQDNILLGGAGNDRLDGDAGNDSLVGGDGDDLLIGGPGNDTLVGGAGADTFYWQDHSHGEDLVSDFEVGVDTLDFMMGGFGFAYTEVLDASNFSTTDSAGLAAGAPGFYVVETGTNTYAVYWDEDGSDDLEGVLIATVQSTGPLSNTDFYISPDV
ncbi:FecR domain-containing protein [Desulfocurvus sp.]|uniref:FecR domain-containing protein n=1 Tax=Desulfocurvus sp. TaxID=2871698 RepID=UPI0025B9870B|nr:FecR domain-containing protein [Desulfocurvus sp.]MCK9241068.1 FecR domain-containing protein [Desulfocurvus sp.]